MEHAMTLSASNAKDECRYCKKKGHALDDCRRRLAKEGKCFVCKNTGHLAKNCPKKTTVENANSLWMS